MDDALLERLIADSQARALPALTKRNAHLPWLDGKIDAVIGMRRTGKTWFLYQRMAELMARGMERESMLFLGFEDERLAGMGAANLHRVIDAFYRLHPDRRDHDCAFFFDEIQVIDGWQAFVRRILDDERAHLCLSGSSAKLLSREIASSLRGRALATEIFPFGLAEALRHVDEEPPRRLPGKRERSRLERAAARYLEVGGFPEVQAVDTQTRIQILQGYVDVVILRDVVERHQVTNSVALRRMLRQLLSAPAAAQSVHKLYNDLRSQGVAVSKDSLHEYLDHLTDAYLLIAVDIRTDSERVRQSNPRKIYPIDPGLAVAYATRAAPGFGALLETAICVELRRRGIVPRYVRTTRGHEVDFAFERAKHEELLQACLSLSEPDTRERELRALTEAMTELRISNASIVTLNEDEVIEHGRKRIRVLPFWRWALEL